MLSQPVTEVGPCLPASSSPADGISISNWDVSAANHEAAQEIAMSQHQPPGLSYTIKDESSFTEFVSFNEFIEALRDTLANHPDREDIYDHHEDTILSSSKKHPLLAKLRGDQQPSRLIEVKLQVTPHQGKGGGTSSSSWTTLAIRDDNVDIMGFSNHNGEWFEVGNNRGKLPRLYNSKPLAGWVINKEEIAKMLAEPSTALGKTFAEDAVRVLSCFSDVAAGGDKPRVALLGLMVMVCDSARLNPVHDAIADDWDTGTRFTEQFITNTMEKYEWMSRGLCQWSRRNYAEPHPTTSQLQDVCLVLNGPPEVVYKIADELSFISFMMDLRRNLRDHPDREDIFDKHPDKNLSSSQDHPLLPRQRAPYPKRWIHVKLQMVDVDETLRTVTLLMRDDNLYVQGFINQQGVVYGLVDFDKNQKKSVMVLPDPYMNQPVKEVNWSVQYGTMLKAASNNVLTKKLAAASLGRDFARKAVRVLSRYPDVKTGDKRRLALAGLIFIVCEPARMAPLHYAFVRGWTTGTGFTKELMKLYVWEYGNKSRNLRNWKDQRYVESERLPCPIEDIQDVYLVLNTPPQPSSSTSTRRTPPGGNHPPPGAGGNNDPPSPPDNNPPPSSPSTPRPPTSSTPTSREAAGGVASTGGGSDNTAGSNRSVSASQPAGRNAAGTGTGSALQPVDEGHSSLSEGNSGSESEDADADDAQDHSRPLVELLAIRADLQVLGTKIIVYDGIRGQIIYIKEEQRKYIKQRREQGDQAMDELVLTGPYTCITAYGCFAIQIDIPDDGAAGISKGGNAAGGLTQWEWDCYDPKYGEEFDKPPVTRTIASLGPGRDVEVTYAVMSNALEATVQVMFWLEDGHRPSDDVVVQGEITARIQDYQVGSVLFSRTKWAGHCFSHTDGSCFQLELARNVLAVPCGSKLYIRVKLGTKFSKSQASGKDLDVTLDFDNGTLARHHEVDGEKIVEVKISWYQKMERVCENTVSAELKQTKLNNFVPFIRSGEWSDIGGRPYMEDAHVCISDLAKNFGYNSVDDKVISFYGVFDGHGGKDAAHYVRDNLPRVIVEDADFPLELEKVVKRSFMQTDSKYAERFFHNKGLSSGTTALIAMIFGRSLLVANAGDSRAVLSRHGAAIEMSNDHRACSINERKRVESLGAYVDDGYLNGMLAVTRALGDWHLEGMKEMGQPGGPLSAEPELKMVTLTKDDEFLIIGSNGIWDVFSSQNAVDFARRRLQDHNDLNLCCMEIVDEAMRRGTSDNLTAVIVSFHQDAPPQNPSRTGRVKRIISAEGLSNLRAILEGQ